MSSSMFERGFKRLVASLRYGRKFRLDAAAA